MYFINICFIPFNRNFSSSYLSGWEKSYVILSNHLNRHAKHTETHICSVCHKAPPVSCRTGVWSPCCCCRQRCDTAAGGTQPMWSPPSAPPCWPAWCPQCLKDGLLKKLAALELDHQNADSYKLRQAFFPVLVCAGFWAGRILKLRSVISRFHRFTRRSSVEMNVWRSELTEMELMW